MWLFSVLFTAAISHNNAGQISFWKKSKNILSHCLQVIYTDIGLDTMKWPHIIDYYKVDNENIYLLK